MEHYYERGKKLLDGSLMRDVRPSVCSSGEGKKEKGRGRERERARLYPPTENIYTNACTCAFVWGVAVRQIHFYPSVCTKAERKSSRYDTPIPVRLAMRCPYSTVYLTSFWSARQRAEVVSGSGGREKGPRRDTTWVPQSGEWREDAVIANPITPNGFFFTDRKRRTAHFAVDRINTRKGHIGDLSTPTRNQHGGYE